MVLTAVLLVLLIVSGCASTSLTTPSPSSTIKSRSEAVALLNTLNSLRIGFFGGAMGDFGPCHADESGLRSAKFRAVSFTYEVEPDKRVSKGGTFWVARGKDSVFGPPPQDASRAKREFEIKYLVDLRTARYEGHTYLFEEREGRMRQAPTVVVTYAGTLGMPVYFCEPESVGSHLLRFEDVTSVKQLTYPQGRGRVKFYNSSGKVIGSLFFMDDDWTQKDDIAASFLMLCPNVR